MCCDFLRGKYKMSYSQNSFDHMTLPYQTIYRHWADDITVEETMKIHVHDSQVASVGFCSLWPLLHLNPECSDTIYDLGQQFHHIFILGSLPPKKKKKKNTDRHI